MHAGKWHPLITVLTVCINVADEEIPESFPPSLFGANGQDQEEDHGKTKSHLVDSFTEKVPYMWKLCKKNGHLPHLL